MKYGIDDPGTLCPLSNKDQIAVLIVIQGTYNLEEIACGLDIIHGERSQLSWLVKPNESINGTCVAPVTSAFGCTDMRLLFKF